MASEAPEDAAPSEPQWDKLWEWVKGPAILPEDLALIGGIFAHLDRNGDGVLQLDELKVLRTMMASALQEAAFHSFVDDDADVGERMDAASWANLHATATRLHGSQWRKVIESIAAVCRITRQSAPVEEPWIVSVDTGGKIVSAWFSCAELTPDERLAVRGLKDLDRWRCLSCAAEAFDAKHPCLAASATPGQRRLSGSLVCSSATPATGSLRAGSAPGSPHTLNRYYSAPMAPRLDRLLSVPSTAPMPGLERHLSVPSSPLAPPAHRRELCCPTGRRCRTLGEMLSHRAMRPIRKRVQKGDSVLIETEGGTAMKRHLGLQGVVLDIYVPAKAVVKQEFCVVEVAKETADTSSVQVTLPVTSVVCLKVPLSPGDLVEAWRPLPWRPGARTQPRELLPGTVLGSSKREPHKIEVSFGRGDTARILQSWVMRVEMSSWTQILRQAPHPTLLFLLCDLRLSPQSPQDQQELESRLRRDFEPHGRCTYVGAADVEAEETAYSQTLSSWVRQARPGSAPSDGKPEESGAPDKCEAGRKRPKMPSRLGFGDTGKILSFDLQRMVAEVLPDRKKHIKVRVPLDELKPNRSPLSIAAVSGPTKMHTFDDDPPLLSLAKQGEKHGVKAMLDGTRQSDLLTLLCEEARDADANTCFHAAVYNNDIALWKMLWTALLRAGDYCDDELPKTCLRLANDWGRTPLWIALEGNKAEFCELLLRSGAAVDQLAPVMPSTDHSAHELEDDATHEFCGGPGMVEAGSTYEVTFFGPSLFCGLRFGELEDRARAPGMNSRSNSKGSAAGQRRPSKSMPPVMEAVVCPLHCEERGFMVTRSFGEAAENCVMAGDVLLSVTDGDRAREANEFHTFRHLDQYLVTAPRPLTFRFCKGHGLEILPLHRACELGYDLVAEHLLQHGAEVHARDSCGRSALDRAVRKRNRRGVQAPERESFQRCIDVLAAHGASEEGRIKVHDADGTPLPFEHPAHWEVCSQMKLEGQYWLRIADVPKGPVTEHLQYVLDRCVGAIGKRVATRDRRDGPPPKKLLIERVQRIENVASLREYLSRRCHMRHSAKNRYQALVPLEQLRTKVDYKVLAGADVPADLDAGLNEVYLLHGTDHVGAAGIARDDFLLSLAGSKHGDAFGKGLYFAEDALKSDEYTKPAPSGHPMAGLRPMLLCRVLLGRVLTSEDNDMSWEVQEVMAGRADSICADRKAAVGTFREFIVFDEDQAYTEYILWYRRIS